MVIDEDVEGFLGRILDTYGNPIGTCFQVADRVIVTAWHVLNDLGADTVGATVTLDPLRGGAAIEARVIGTDPTHDLALLQPGVALPNVVKGIAPSDHVELGTSVTITGVVQVEGDDDHRYLDAPGTWAGRARRKDGVRMSRVTSDAVMKGMSGSPVIRNPDGMVVGVVSGRYNTGDGWLEHTAWIARAEDLTALIDERAEAATRQAAASMLLGPTPTAPWCLVLTAEAHGAEELTTRVSDVIERFTGVGPVFDTIHASPAPLAVLDALKSPDNWAVAVEAIVQADYMVADVTDFQPAVMLLLGIRSVVRRGVTISVCRKNSELSVQREAPFNVQETRVITYDTNDFYERLGDLLREGSESLKKDLNYLDLPAYHAVRAPRSEAWAKSTASTVLMLCPFSPAYSTFFADLREVILSNTRNREPVRMLDLRSPRLVGQALYEQIRWSTLCIVDWTHWRANVFFELGVRLACCEIDPLCIYDAASTQSGPDESEKLQKLQQAELLKSMFGPVAYTRKDAPEHLRGALREWRSATLDTPWRSSGAALPPGSTFSIAQGNFVWKDDPLLTRPHDEHLRTINVIAGKDPEQQPERLPLFANSAAFDDALQESVRERWIAAWLYLKHLDLESGADISYADELRTIAARAQLALRKSDIPRHARVLSEIAAFLDADQVKMKFAEVIGLKASAKSARDDQNWPVAIGDLEKVLEILLAGRSETSEDTAAELADAYGMIGGVERRWALASRGADRIEHLARSVIAYDQGFEHEHRLSKRDATTYNRINRLIGRVLMQPAILKQESGDVDLQAELAEAERRVTEQVDGARIRDPWAYCDLLTIQLLSGKRESASTLNVLVGLRPANFVYQSLLDTLRPLADVVSTTRPHLGSTVARLESLVNLS
jgi:Trypsin-like peptidase domain